MSSVSDIKLIRTDFFFFFLNVVTFLFTIKQLSLQGFLVQTKSYGKYLITFSHNDLHAMYISASYIR